MKSQRATVVFVACLLCLCWQAPVLSESTPNEPTAPNDPTDGGTEMTVPEHGIYYLEIVTPDPKAQRDFYSKAFGWEFSEPTPELGNAYFASLPNGTLWGIRGPLREDEEPIVRTYLRVEDLQAATRKAEELGATIALEGMEIPGRGKIAIYLLGGIEQGLWQVP